MTHRYPQLPSKWQPGATVSNHLLSKHISLIFLLLVPQEIRLIIVKILIRNITQSKLLELQLLEASFLPLIQHYIYRHVNIRSFKDAKLFLNTLLVNDYLTSSVRTLQLSLDLSDDEDGAIPIFSGLWVRVLPRLTRLRCLNLCYSHFDDDALKRLTDMGNFPTSLEKLHLKPLHNERLLHVCS